MKQTELEQLIDRARRRILSNDERTRLNILLEGDPAAWPERDEELALTQLLSRLPDAPVSSNFSVRVMRAIDLADRQPGRNPSAGNSLRRWFARLSWATAALALAGLSWVHYQGWQRAETARSVKFISEVAAVPSVEILRDFDAVQSLGNMPPAMDVQGDTELLTALQ